MRRGTTLMRQMPGCGFGTIDPPNRIATPTSAVMNPLAGNVAQRGKVKEFRNLACETMQEMLDHD